MDSFQFLSEPKIPAAHRAVGSSDDAPLELDEIPAGKTEDSYEAKTVAADPLDIVDSRGVIVQDFSSSPADSSHIKAMYSTPSLVEHRDSSEILTEESDDPQATLLSSTTSRPQSSASSVETRWRPLYLQTRVQAAAMCVFFIMAALVEALLVISRKNDGLATSKEEMRYLWTYGPTALLALVSAGWGMVAFQAQLVAPWYRLILAPTKAKDSIFLDYLNMITPAAIFNSLKNHDWVVSISLSVGLLIRLVIVLSTGLINLDLIKVTDTSYPTRITRKFIDGNETVKVPPNEILGMLDDTLMEIKGGYRPFPDGTSDLYAWETFETDAAVGTEIHTTVTGFSANLACEPAVAEMRYHLNQDYLPEGVVDAVYPCGMPWITMNISLSSGDCVGVYTNEARTWYGGGRTGPVRFSTLFNDTCQGAGSLETQRLFSIFGVVDAIFGDFSQAEHCYSSHIPEEIRLLRSNALICTPVHLMHDLDIRRIGTSDPIVQVNENSSSRPLESLHPWTIMDTIITSMKSHVWGSLPTIIHKVDMVGPEVISDAWTYFVFGIGGATKQHADSMFDSATLEATLVSYYQKHAAQLAPALLMRSCNETRQGTALLLENRLLVSPWICHIIAGLLVIAGLASLAIGTLPQRKISLSFNPSIPYGMVKDFSHISGAYSGLEMPVYGSLSPDSSPQVLRKLPYLAEPTLRHRTRTASSFQAISEDQSYNYHKLQDDVHGRKRAKVPFILRPYTRFFASLATLAIMVMLRVTLKESEANLGLGEAAWNSHLQFLWTSLPAVVFSGVSLTLKWMATAAVCLSPYWNMARSARFNGSMGSNLLGELLPVSTFRAARLGSVAAATAATAAMLAPWFTIFSPALFQAKYFPKHLTASVLTTGSFSTSWPIGGEAQMLAGVVAGKLPTTLAFQILQENMTYPAFTWENLAFPEFRLNAPDSSNGFNLTDTPIKARVPAIRSSLSCRPYGSSEINSALWLGHPKDKFFKMYPPSWGIGLAAETSNVSNPLVVKLTGETCAFDKPNYNPLSVIFDTTIGGTTPSHSSFMAGLKGGGRSDTRGYGLLSGNKIATNGHSCKPFVFVWGHFNISGDQEQTEVFASAVACNPTAELVDVNMTFREPELAIDSLEVDETSLRQTSFGEHIDTNIGLLSMFDYADIRSIFKDYQPQIFDAFASLLTTSPYALTPEDIGDPKRIQDVENAIKFQYGILQTQHIHIHDRSKPERSDATLPNYAATPLNQTNDALSYPAVITVPNVNRRVIQDPTSTYIIEGLLAVVLALTLISWALSPSPDVLPGSPTSIANVLSLAASGNLLEFIAKGGDGGPPPDDLFDKYIFWLGSRRVNGSDGGEQERFGIWVLTREEFEVMEESEKSKSP
ncbi:hypothetical protein KVR01_004821 [Diaporthe batatas]|uniref:uncharacterized protein n=1 Tax=Diaporthe batatas TaxID=748121 RepID=UPI001D0459ED|nr:uncharacterized protein KVR01_004821 [Diaporthe batatas]KAG8166269.1 hypothetical protein KVR01_004821 [Diaporthe batatas]